MKNMRLLPLPAAPPAHRGLGKCLNDPSAGARDYADPLAAPSLEYRCSTRSFSYGYVPVSSFPSATTTSYSWLPSAQFAMDIRCFSRLPRAFTLKDVVMFSVDVRSYPDLPLPTGFLRPLLRANVPAFGFAGLVAENLFNPNQSDPTST